MTGNCGGSNGTRNGSYVGNGKYGTDCSILVKTECKDWMVSATNMNAVGMDSTTA